jgi:hypothetical protein
MSFLVPIVTQDAVWEVGPGQLQMRRNQHVAGLSDGPYNV